MTPGGPRRAGRAALAFALAAALTHCSSLPPGGRHKPARPQTQTGSGGNPSSLPASLPSGIAHLLNPSAAPAKVHQPSEPAKPASAPPAPNPRARKVVARACHAFARRLHSVKLARCLQDGLRPTGFKTAEHRPILMRNYPAKPGEAAYGRVLLIGGVHGDEFSAVSIIFRWMRHLNARRPGHLHWHVVPSVNVDGLMHHPATRVNADGVDLNRNLPTPNWHARSRRYWTVAAHRRARYYPGSHAGSEPENRWLMHEIATFKPDAIITIHAPYDLLDYDGPLKPPSHLGVLRLHELGTYPGSLGNYAGMQRHLSVLTLELPHACTMPPQAQSRAILRDLLGWLDTKLQHPRQPTVQAKR